MGLRTNEKIDAINDRLKILAKDKGITYIDINSHMKNAMGNLALDYTIEGLHISALGYCKLLDILKPYLDV